MASSKSSTGRKKTWVHWLTGLTIAGLAATAVSEMRVREPVPGFQDAMDKAIQTLDCDGQPILAEYTGIKGVDIGLQVLVIAFTPGTIGLDKGFQVLQLYFLLSAFSLVCVFSVESGRKANRWSMVAFPAAWALFYQTVGGAIIIPCYFLAHMRTTARQRDYFSAESQALSTAFAEALIPSLLIGFLLPTVLMYLPIWDMSTRQRLIALWQPCPLFVSMFSQILQPVFSASRSKPRSETKYVNTIYVISFAVSAFSHVATVAYCLTSSDPDISLSTVFDLRLTTSTSPLVISLKYIFQVDFWIIFVASLLWAFLAVYDMRLEKRTEVGMIQTLLYMVAGVVLVGPAAVLSATWYWREQRLNKAKSS